MENPVNTLDLKILSFLKEFGNCKQKDGVNSYFHAHCYV